MFYYARDGRLTEHHSLWFGLRSRRTDHHWNTENTVNTGRFLQWRTFSIEATKLILTWYFHYLGGWIRGDIPYLEVTHKKTLIIFGLLSG